jgi:Putative prokaryotic signal transducing protein
VSHRARIGTCSGLADAALVRSVFSAHGIHVVVGSEHHAGVLTGLGGGFVSLDIWVDEGDREDAMALLRDLRERGARDTGDRSVDCDDEIDDDGGGKLGGQVGEDRDDDLAPRRRGDLDEDLEPRNRGDLDKDLEPRSADDLAVRIARRRDIAIALLLGCCLTFGTAHAFTRAWLRAVLLAAVETIALVRVIDGDLRGALAIVGIVAFDVIGAVWRVQTASRSNLPIARMRAR